MENKEYTGSVYLAVVGPDRDYAVCRDSINEIAMRQGDTGPHFVRATKGYEARQMHITNFIASENSFLFLMDHDQTFPQDILERLRRHKLPYVSGLYMRRRTAPAFSVWYKPQGNPYEWPLLPWMDRPKPGKLHELGGSGWGCVLIHRDVIMAVRGILKGEAEVLEDDMDVWPYDIDEIMGAITAIENAPNLDIAQSAAQILRREFRVLRGRHGPDAVGSDLRFPFFAKCAGFPLMGDPDARCGHVIDFVIDPSVLDQQVDESRKNQRIADKQIGAMRAEYADWRKARGYDE